MASDENKNRMQISGYPTPPHIDIEAILARFENYQPRSTLVSMQQLRDSRYLCLKKYRQGAYYGEIVNGKRHGTGIMIVGERVYEGQWQGDCRSGRGFEEFPNGCIYQGCFVNGKPEGLGKHQWPNGQFYEGEWLNGLRHGSGIWHGAKGDSYVGEWKFGKADGRGIHLWINGDRYQGDFKQNLKHGKGKEQFSNGDSYEGDYYHGKSHGTGEYYWRNGSFYKGGFKEGKRDGFGVWKASMGNSDKYEGEYCQDRKHGYGIFTWYSGNVYKGNYDNDERQGYGEMYWTDGSYYKGEWRNGLQHGQGKLYTPQHGVRHGIFRDNNLVELIVEEEFTPPPEKPKIIPVKAQPNYFPKSFRKYTSLEMRGIPGADLYGRIKQEPGTRRNSHGTVKRETKTPKKEGTFKRKAKPAKEVKPLTKRVPYFSAEVPKLQGEDDTEVLLQTNLRRIKPFMLQSRLNQSTAL